MLLQAKGAGALPLGIYYHVPFCARSCDFCAFYQEAPKRPDILAYLKGIEQELALRPVPRQADTVFWGGGTPGLLTARDIYRLGAALLDRLPGRPLEWTVEMAPSTVTHERLKALQDLGVTRVSMGVQSFDSTHLETLGRPHTRSQIYRAIERLKEAAFTDLNLDLMFAIPGQSLGDWEADLREATAWEPTHLSTYCLTFEDDTALWWRWRAGQTQRASEEQEAAYFELCWEVMAQAGFVQYEISNYARPGHECRHNLHTWMMGEWLGFGPAAASQFGGRRFMNVPDQGAWLAGLACEQPHEVEVVPLSEVLVASDALIFGLRMNRGVHVDALQRRFPALDLSPARQVFLRLEDEGLGAFCGPRFQLTPTGRLLADSIAIELLDAWERQAASPAAATADLRMRAPQPAGRA